MDKPKDSKPQAPNAFDALIANNVAKAKATGNTGKTATSTSSRNVLAKLRDLGAELKGLTAEEVRHSLQLSKSSQQTRKAIRTAQESAVEAGDLVFCRNVTESVDPNGDPVQLSVEYNA